MGYIFISYSHKDKSYVHKLQEALQHQGFDVWIDDRIDFGTSWPKVIQDQLDSCDAFIVVVSENSYESEWVQNEVTRAKRKKKPFFPLLLSGDPWLSVETIQYVDVSGEKFPPEEFYNQLGKYAEREASIEIPISANWITQDWKAYENKKYKFMFRYPRNGEIVYQADNHLSSRSK